MTTRPPATTGLRHLALWIQHFEATEAFYTDLLGMKVEWRPDADNVYLTSGVDNLALHRAPADFNDAAHQRLDHLGFILGDIEHVDQWFSFLKSHHVEMKTEPRTHRDGARSFYCFDPDGNTVQIIWHPPIAKCDPA